MRHNKLKPWPQLQSGCTGVEDKIELSSPRNGNTIFLFHEFLHLEYQKHQAHMLTDLDLYVSLIQNRH